MATETVIQQVGEAPEIEAYRIGLLKSAKELADKGINSRLAHAIAYQKHQGTTQRCIDVSQNALQNAAELVEA